MSGLDKMTGVQRGLVSLMSEISERCWCAGWMHGLEFSLWSMIGSDNQTFGQDEVSKDEARQLRELSEACGGWIAWRDGETFVTLDEWREILRAVDAEAAR